MSAETNVKTSKTQFSLRASLVLTAASAFWVWIFREMSPVEMAVVGGVAITAGLVGHVVYTFWLPWRVTVIATVLLLYNAILGAQLLLQSGSGDPWFARLAVLFEIAVMPVEMMRHVTSPRDIAFSLAIVLGTLILTAAHSIRPNLPSAIITALGIAIWYGSSIMIMIYGG
jgi:hypothetical protein